MIRISQTLQIVLLFMLLMAAVFSAFSCKRNPNTSTNSNTGAGNNGAAPTAITMDLGGKNYTINGPYAHENMAVFLLCSPNHDDTEYITLDEGLKSGQVKVTEQEQARVNQLLIENTADKPLFLQEGDRVIGGKQDRIIQWTLVIPPHSGRQPLPTFCVEQSRWQANASSGMAFGSGGNNALAPSEVRKAAKYDCAQDKVWEKVARSKADAQQKLDVKSSNSSITEAMESAPVKKISEDASKALMDALAKNPDAVGVAIAVNGKIREVNIYPGNKLLAKVYPHLIQSYAYDSALAKDEPTSTTQPAASPQAVVTFLKEGEKSNERTEKINDNNKATIRDLNNNTAESDAIYNNEGVHYQKVTR